ncbi:MULTISPECIES: helix-turn-helix transcriptional regulator [unclassified Streptomyces]|uniref:helix-turn-helix transcriptional regulator n=1 Tax=unclassified Streptomyces TaxID=2593676 RepID=UPI002ED5E2B0|nr:helix-turn-helix transcriptional regulator [Streptomyces sp. NBC_00891]WSY05828.1 helix-turn-helix transcriptional regulator [Streptomyces sp. NBC_00890]WSZ07452.1 helix-turn-helix transcriptional regulator [Streptomyces sp. NBC_00869]WSZ25049.1 helix-turn-helix transcriptional regulator [Streptomyces sp. NBC_00870]
MDGEIGDFLRSRRARISPEDVGLNSYGRRRVPGLRREEVAQLAGVSVDYYIRLEQGRGPSVSDAVLDAIARVLRLDETEHAHLRTVARPKARKASAPSVRRVRPGLRLLLDLFDRAPAFVLGRRMDVLAWNALGDALGGFSGLPAGERNMPRQAFLAPGARELYPDWPAVAAETVAYLRLDAGLHPDDKELAALVGELSLKSEDFRRLWADHQVKAKTYGVKRMVHPVVGELTLPYETLAVPGEPELSLVVYTPEPGSETAERVALLASWSADERDAPVAGA